MLSYWLFIAGNPYWSSLRQVFSSLPSLVSMVEVCNELVRGSSTSWLSALAASPNTLGQHNRLVVTAVFLYTASSPDSVIEAAKVTFPLEPDGCLQYTCVFCPVNLLFGAYFAPSCRVYLRTYSICI